MGRCAAIKRPRRGRGNEGRGRCLWGGVSGKSGHEYGRGNSAVRGAGGGDRGGSGACDTQSRGEKNP